MNGRQDLRPVGPDQDVVLEPGTAAESGPVRAGLDREDHPRFQGETAAGLEHRTAVVVTKTDVVPAVVSEAGPVPTLFQDAARGPVHLLSRGARPDGTDRRALRLSYGAQERSLPLSPLTDAGGAGHVAPVAVRADGKLEKNELSLRQGLA